MSRAVARALIGVCIFIYSGSARLVSFEIKLISKEVSWSKPEYMNIHPPISVLATALLMSPNEIVNYRIKNHICTTFAPGAKMQMH